MTHFVYRGRFAPSPTGPLHLGSLVAAVGSWLMARKNRGQWLVRIEDLDPPREVPGAALQQIETLKAFGMVSDEAILWQSQRSERYSEVLKNLLQSGHAFECFCSRKDLSEHEGIHHFCVRHDDKEKPAAIRLKLPNIEMGFEDQLQGRFSQVLARDVGDMVLKRADGFWAYQLAVVVDDADQGISHIVRGQDLLDSTPRQLYLQQVLGLPTPEYSHLPLVRDEQGNKLSKSLSAVAIDDRDPMPALRWCWRFLGQNEAEWPQNLPPERALWQAASRFMPGKIPSTS
jgi:glutamyl-Q tRNA(Asp) synthetase